MTGFRIVRKGKEPAVPVRAEEVAETPAAGEVPASPAAGPAAAEVAEVAERAGDGDTVQVNCHLPAALHRRLRLASVRRGEPLAETLAWLVRENTPEA